MGMIVRTNMSALNTDNVLARNNKSQQSGSAKLASGIRINKASDDASGLAVSEKMKNQIKAFDTAANFEDGADIIQKAESYMSEVRDILDSMAELAEKSAGSYLLRTERVILQDEMDKLCAEIDIIASTASFNGRKLMDGTADLSDVLKRETSAAQEDTYSDDFETDAAYRADEETSAFDKRSRTSLNDYHTDKLFGGLGSGVKVMRNHTGKKTDAGNSDVSDYEGGITLDISDRSRASAAKDAIHLISRKVSDEMSGLDEYHDLAEKFLNNLNTASENTAAAKSRIRDTDMAREMVRFIKKNIAAQAEQAMLAQANSQPQNVILKLQ